MPYSPDEPNYLTTKIWMVNAHDDEMQFSKLMFEHAFSSQDDAHECVEAGRKAMPKLSWAAFCVLLNGKEHAIYRIERIERNHNFR